MGTMTDVDGITSTSILIKTFTEKLNYPVQYYIPNRLNEGYGMREFGIDTCKELGCTLIITVDNGITSVSEVEYARSLGIDVVVTDHHECQSEIPNACAVINPKQHDCKYPNENLAGCGVAFKLACALYPNLLTDNDYLDYLNLVAFGSVADVVPIIDENRIFTYFGTLSMGNSGLIGLKTLISLSGIDDLKISAGQIGFNIAPKINATGRIGEPRLGVELFITKDPMIALEISKKLIELNNERQEIENRIIEEAFNEIESNLEYFESNVLVVAMEGWHTGILGIATSKICEKYNKPTILLSIEDGLCKGSARSIPEFDMFGALCECKEYMFKFGGHPMACGMTFELSQLETIKAKLKTISNSLTEYDLSKKLKVDCELLTGETSFKLIKELDLLEPHGVGNPNPQFLSSGLSIYDKIIIGKNKNHTKLILDRNGAQITSLLFNSTLDEFKINDKIDAVVNLNINEFRGKRTIQYMIKDVKLNE